MVWHVRHNRALHNHLLALTAMTESVPWIKDSERLSLTELAPNFWRGDSALWIYGKARHPGAPERPQRSWMRDRT